MKKTTYLHGSAPHRHTQSDYLATLLDAVPLETWREVIDATVAAARQGDAQARNWLASYLVGRPKTEAPSPLAVTAERISGDDELVQVLAKPFIRNAFTLPSFNDSIDNTREVREAIAAELPGHIQP